MIFIDNKYTKWYFNIINKAKSRISIEGRPEIHHIIPKSLNGTNNKNNLVKLTKKEHFICHLLLVKMTTGKDKSKMVFASNRMLSGKDRYVPCGRIYQIVKDEFAEQSSKLHKNKIISEETKIKMSKAHENRGPVSEETKFNISKAKTGQKYKPTSEEGRKNKSKCKLGNKNANFGKTPSDETKNKMSESAKSRQPIACHCGKKCSPSNYARWHGNNCKF